MENKIDKIVGFSVGYANYTSFQYHVTLISFHDAPEIYWILVALARVIRVDENNHDSS